MAEATIHAPDGTLITIPEENVAAALKAHAYLPGQPPPQTTQTTPGGPLTEAEMHERPEPAPEPGTPDKGFSAPILLKNRETGALEPVPPGDVKQALSTTHDVANPKAMVNVTAPDGGLTEIPAGNLKAALAAGGTISSSAELERQGIQEQTKQDFGAGTTAALGLGSPLQELVSAGAEKLGILTPEQRANTELVRETAKEEHPYAYWAGKIPGEVAVAAGLGGVAGKVSKAVGLGEAATTLAKAGKAAVEGAVYSTPEVARHIIDKDPAGAAEALALGVVGNVGLHAVFSAGGKVLGKLGEAGVEDAETLARRKEVAENTVLKAYGVPLKKYDAAREMLPALHDAVGITAADTKETAIRKIDQLEASGPRIGKAIDTLNKAEGKATIISEALQKTSKELEEIASKALSEGDKQTANALAEMRERVSVLARKPDVDFDMTQRLKSDAGQQAVFGLDTGVAANAKKGAYAIIRSNIMGAENAAAESLGGELGGEALEGLKKDRALYTLHKFFGDNAEREANKETMTAGHSFHLARHGITVALAHTLLGPIGAPAAIGLAIGEQAIKSSLKKRVFGQAIKAIEGSNTPNTSVTLDAIKSLDTHISDQVKGMFSSMAGREVSRHTDVLDSTIGRLLPNGGSGQSHDQQVKVLRQAAIQYKTDPGGVADHLAKVTKPLRDEGLHQVADAYTDHQLRLMKVIDSVLPADPEMKQAHPFASSVAPEDISPATKARYTRALSIATDPTKLLGLVKANAISPTDVAICAASNPQALAKMRTAIVDDAMSRKPDLTYQHRISLAIMMGTYLDESTKQLPVLQGAFIVPMAQGGPKPIKTDEKASKEMESAYLPDSARGIVSAR